MEERMMLTSDITSVMGFTQLYSVLKKKKRYLFFHNFYFKRLLSIVSDSQFQTQNASPSIPAPPRHFLKMRIEVVVWGGGCVLITQLCLTLCYAVDCSLPGSCIHGILQTRILEWVVIPLSRGSFRPRDQTQPPALQADSS